MKIPKYILIFCSGLLKRMLLFFAFVFSLSHSPKVKRGHAFSFRIMLLLLVLNSSFIITNCFSQWLQQTLPVNKPITGIEFVDTLHGWACTSRGTPADTGYVLYTSNGGTNWLVQFKQYNFAFADIDMVNSLTGYTGGFLFGAAIPRMYKTTNGGTTWDSLSLNINHFIEDIFFINENSGYTCNSFFGPDVRTTTDGGNTWIVRISGISAATGRIFFLNYNTGFVAAQFSLYKTTNAGGIWTPNGNFIDQIASIFFLNESTGWLGMTNRKIQYTSNGGANWTSQPNPQYLGTIRAIYFVNGNTGWAGGALEYIYKTTNGGQLWGYQIDSSGSSSISFTDSLHGWTGNTGPFTIGHTINGGGPITYVGIININNQVPDAYKLYQNYPNPFNSQTIIRFSLMKYSYAKLVIHDILGKEKILWQSDNILQAGTHELKLDAKDLSSGVYFYKLIVTNKEGTAVFEETKKMILVR